jgi:hypothetical protein
MADSSTITIEGLSEFDAKLAKLKTDNPGFERRLRAVIRKILGHARANLRKAAGSGLRMDSDPRQAYKAVRFAVYKRILGGQVNILNSRRAGSGSYYEPPRHPSVRGGNRRPQSMRTRQLMSYQGIDRSFILRFLNQGTKDRNIQHLKEIKRADGTSKFKWSSDNGMYGNRGAIKARNWFQGASLAELQSVSHEMQELIDNIINDEFK